MRVAIMAALAGAIGFAGPAVALDKVTFGTNWVADPEAGGYYQALSRRDLCQIRPRRHHSAGRADVERRHAADRRQDRVLHGRRHDRRFSGGAEQHSDHRRRRSTSRKTRRSSCRIPASASTNGGPSQSEPAFVSAGAVNTFWAWMRLAYGFKDENIKPYNFNSAPFIAEPHSIQQGYLTSEPLEVEKQGGFKPNIFLLADYGYSTYATLVESRRDIVEKHPDIVQRFVDASAIGWYHYLYGDNARPTRRSRARIRK